MKTRSLLALLGALAIAAPVAAQHATDHGLSIVLFDTPKPGTTRTFVRFTDAAASPGANPATSDFALVTSVGGAKVGSVKPFSSLGLKTVTIAAIDQSGSFKNGMNASWQVLEHLAQTVGPNEQLGLMQFGLQLTEYPTRSAPADVLSDIAQAKAQKNEFRTLLLSSTLAAIQRAAREGAAGFREVLVFTDAGEESEAMDAKLVAEEARAKGVRVSIFLHIPPNPSVKLASRIDELRNLRLRTGGIETTLAAPTQAIADIDKARSERAGWYAIDAEFCGMTDTQFDGSLRVQFKQDKAFSADVPFKTLLGKEAEAACPGAKLRCGEACAEWQTCDTTKGLCAAKACAQDAECGTNARCDAKLCVAGKRGMPWWLYAAIAGALGLIVLGVVLLRKKPEPAPAPPVEEPKAEPVAAAQIEEPKVDPFAQAAVSLEALPETHLVAIHGPFAPGQKWRLHQRLTRVGAAAEADIRFDVAQISGNHAEFQLFPNGNLFVKDNGSSNGTSVNGRRLAKGERTALKVGDQVQLSTALLLRVERPGAPVLPDAPPVAETPQAPAADAGAPKPRAKSKTLYDRGD